MGKLMIRKLREDWTKGDRTKWKAFHDEFLSYGGPPITMVRAAMMKEATPKAVFSGRRPDPADSFSQRLDDGRRYVRRRAQTRNAEAVAARPVGEPTRVGAGRARGR